MGLLTSLAAAKYLFSGGGEKTVTYRPLSPEEIDEQRRLAEAASQKAAERAEQFHSSNFYQMYLSVEDWFINSLIFGDVWWYCLWIGIGFFVLGVVDLIVMTALYSANESRRCPWDNAVKLTAIKGLTFILWGVGAAFWCVDVFIGVIRGLCWLISPAV